MSKIIGIDLGTTNLSLIHICTKERRPDLFERAELSEKERKVYGEE